MKNAKSNISVFDQQRIDAAEAKRERRASRKNAEAKRIAKAKKPVAKKRVTKKVSAE